MKAQANKHGNNLGRLSRRKHSKAGEKLRGNQRKGQPYIRRSSAELKQEANV